MKIVIVIPTYNEKENLANLVTIIFQHKLNLQIIVVDDNSPDGTGKIADVLASNYPVEVVHRQGKQGLGTAYRVGFQKALELDADLIFEMDADFSHDPKLIPAFVNMIQQENCAAVVGSRRIKGGKIIGWSWLRHFESSGAMWFSRVVLGLKTKDVTSGYKCYTQAAVRYLLAQGVGIKSSGYAFQEETIYRLEKAGLKIAEIPIIFQDRKLGKSKLSKKDIVNFFTTIFRLKNERVN